MARTYKRDSNGRFAGGGGASGGGGKSRPATKQLQRGTNRLTRDNAGRITSVGGSGATAYGGRIRTASGKRRATTVAKGIGKAPKGTIGKARGLKADNLSATRGARLGGTRRTMRAAAPGNTLANKTGQNKTLNKFNSRPERTRGAYVSGRYVDKAKLTGRQAFDLSRSDDRTAARNVTKAVRLRAAAPAKAQVRQSAANRVARAFANQKRTVEAVKAKGGKRFSPTRRQKKSLVIADAARQFYSSNRVNSLPTFKVNVNRPGFRLPRGMR